MKVKCYQFRDVTISRKTTPFTTQHREGIMGDKNKQQQLVKLSEESLMRQPEEVFDLLEKIGEG